MSNRARAGDSQAGSAFVIALMVLLILSILGLALAVVSETEEQLGATEKIIDRTYFAAETGLHAAISRLLVAKSIGGERLAIREPRLRGNDVPDLQFGYRIGTSTLYKVASFCAPWSSCEEDDATQYRQEAAYLIGSSVAQRVAWPDNIDSPFEASSDQVTVLAEQAVGVGFLALPTQELSADDTLEGKGTTMSVF